MNNIDWFKKESCNCIGTSLQNTIDAFCATYKTQFVVSSIKNILPHTTYCVEVWANLNSRGILVNVYVISYDDADFASQNIN